MINPDSRCTACGACAQRCPRSCISMEENEYGFLYPRVDAAQCVGCGICDKVCHLNSASAGAETKEAFACVHRSEKTVKGSTSGGAFSAIAERIFALGGVVYGCGYLTPTEPHHIRIEDPEDIDRLRGSKYVQSTMGDSYKQVLEDLCAGKWVLFTGTPCQVAGLKAFLGRPYETLVTADIICHGVPSAAYFRKFIAGYEKKHRCSVLEFDFRSKSNSGWSCAGICRTENSGHIKNRKAYYFDNYYYDYFLRGEIYRDSCYSCKYANLCRPGDFTLGDFWGAEGQKLSFNATDGCSLVLLNTEKAKSIFKELNMYSAKADLAFAVANNTQLREPSKHTELRETLLREYRECSAEEIQKRFEQRFRIARAKARIKYSVPEKMRKLLLKYRYSTK